MAKKGYTPEQIINKLREAEILLNQGSTVGEASRTIGVTEQTYYRWRKEYGCNTIYRSIDKTSNICIIIVCIKKMVNVCRLQLNHVTGSR